MNLHDVPPCTYVTFCRAYTRVRRVCACVVQAAGTHARTVPCACACACACARGPASMWAEIPCSGRCWTIFPWPPSRYETRYDYTLSAHRRQGRTVLPRILHSTRLDLDPETIYYATHFLSYSEVARLCSILIFDMTVRRIT